MAVLAIGRQQASLGHTIGRAVADRLQCRVVDATTVGAEGLQYGARIEARGPDLEEHQPSLLDRLNDEQRRYRTMLRCAVANTAASGDVVIIGLASPVILHDIRHVLKVAIVADEEVRIQRLVARARADGGELSADSARRTLRRSDRQRAGYLSYLFGSDWLDPFAHDVVINTSRIRSETVVDQLLRALQHPELQPTLESREHLAELALSSRIEAERATRIEPPDDGFSNASWSRLR